MKVWSFTNLILMNLNQASRNKFNGFSETTFLYQAYLNLTAGYFKTLNSLLKLPDFSLIKMTSEQELYS